MATDQDLEPLCKLEDMLVRWLVSKDISWTRDQSGTFRVYRGFENREVAQNAFDQSIPYREGEESASDEPSEGGESSQIRTPCIMVSVEQATAIGPSFAGNWTADVSIQVCSSAYDQTHGDHRRHVNEVLNLVATDEIRDELRTFDAEWDCSMIVFGSLQKHTTLDGFVHELKLTFQHYTTRRIADE